MFQQSLCCSSYNLTRHDTKADLQAKTLRDHSDFSTSSRGFIRNHIIPPYRTNIPKLIRKQLISSKNAMCPPCVQTLSWCCRGMDVVYYGPPAAPPTVRFKCSVVAAENFCETLIHWVFPTPMPPQYLFLVGSGLGLLVALLSSRPLALNHFFVDSSSSRSNSSLGFFL